MLGREVPLAVSERSDMNLKRPTSAPNRAHQEHKNLKRSLLSSGVERSDKNNDRPTWPCDRAVLNPS